MIRSIVHILIIVFMKKLSWSLLFFTILICSCNNKGERSEIVYKYVEVCNPMLESEIVQYQRTIDSDEDYAKRRKRGDSVYVAVSIRNLNDSIKRYVLFPVTDCYFLSDHCPFFISTIDGQDVFFCVEAGKVNYGYTTNFFSVSEEQEMLLMKRYFPKRYREKKTKGYLSNCENSHPEMCFLTFLRDSLIAKTIKRGSIFDKAQYPSLEGENDNKMIDTTKCFHSASLKGKRWVERHENKYKRWSYTVGDSVIVDSTIYKFNGKNHVLWHLYYLADEVPEKFDFSKIGKNTSGKYIIRFCNGRMTYNEILELDERRFTIRHTYYGDSLVFNRAK